MTTSKTLAAIVLCGGRSSRMGRDKALLQIDGHTFLQHTCDIAAKKATPVIVVAAANQQLPQLNRSVVVVRDEEQYPGPLPALQRGLNPLVEDLPPDQIDQTAVWVTGCDTPFVTTEVIESLWQGLLKHKADAATLTQDGRDNPLLAIYQLKALQQLNEFLDSGQVRATDFLNSLNVFRLPVEAISQDQHCPAATTNLNTQDDINKAFGTHQSRTDN